MSVLQGLYRKSDVTVTLPTSVNSARRKYGVWCEVCDRWVIQGLTWSQAVPFVEDHESGHVTRTPAVATGAP